MKIFRNININLTTKTVEVQIPIETALKLEVLIRPTEEELTDLQLFKNVIKQALIKENKEED